MNDINEPDTHFKRNARSTKLNKLNLTPVIHIQNVSMQLHLLLTPSCNAYADINIIHLNSSMDIHLNLVRPTPNHIHRFLHPLFIAHCISSFHFFGS